MFKKEIAKGRRKCGLCSEPIKIGEKCFSTYIQTRYGLTGVHLHLRHIKFKKCIKCNQKFRCQTTSAKCVLGDNGYKK